ncbi:Gypsy retrotransposon integrase-like protein 1 [Recurvomyces mirabilis]|nr:Gypsy retrotransposon integrase-like protein 1 [Recurvomyces mirabilis]
MNLESKPTGAMEHASPEDYASDGDLSTGEDQEVKVEDSNASPSNGTHGTGLHASGIKAHMQKRRRVTRACDECRRKKIKCDGKQPCTHCTVYSYDCTYDQPSNRRRNPAPQYVENLEHRVHRAETLLHILIPNLDLNDPGIEAAVAQGWIPGAPGRGNPTAVNPASVAPSVHDAGIEKNKSDTNLESMVRAVAQIDMDEQGHWDYHGHSSGLSFVRRMREQLGDLMGPDTKATPFVKSRPMSQLLDSPRSTLDSPGGGDISPGAATELPPQSYAREICGYAVNDAAVLLRVVHGPSFWKSFDGLYNKSPEQFTNADNTFLPLYHTAMALGHLFCKDETGSLDQQGYENAIQQGFIHFRTARQLMDIADCRDLTSIQAVMFMIIFLQSSAKLSQCYAYVGVALRSALRMGLHRSHAGNFTPIEAETRKRVFWIVRKMDIYVGAMLGLPQTLSDDDIDQEFPLEIDDEYITDNGILPMPEGTVSLMTAFNAHTRLVILLSKIVRKVYPIKTQDTPDKSYSVPFSVIREIESDLEEWKNSLPPILNPCQAPTRYIRVQQLLRLSYAHAQVMLYRPFLHYVAMEKRSSPVDQRAYACAASYVNVSRNIVHIVTQMKQKGLLNGAHWFIMYTSFFAILSLVYFAAENPDNATTQAVMKDALEGRRCLASLARRSMAADRCTATLNGIFQRLPGWMQEGQQNPLITRKRQFDSSTHDTPPPINPQASRSHPDVSVVGHGRGVPIANGQVRRASTFPRHGVTGVQMPVSSSPTSLDASWPSGASSFGPQTPVSGSFDTGSMARWNDQNMLNGINQLMPQNFSNPALPDLSAMIFPTADEPFGYPNQPLTTFENNQQFAKNNQYTSNNQPNFNLDSTVPMGPRPDSKGRDDNIEAQFFALPPYMQEQQRRQLQQQRQDMSFATSNGLPAFANNQGMAGMQMPNGGLGNNNIDGTGAGDGNNNQWMQQAATQSYGNLDIQNLFGGSEWNPMLHGLHGFPSQ